MGTKKISCERDQISGCLRMGGGPWLITMRHKETCGGNGNLRCLACGDGFRMY